MDVLRAEAMKQRELGRVEIRPCWNCRPVNRGLKTVGFVIYCLLCAHWYFKGQDLTEPKKRLDKPVAGGNTKRP